MPDNQLSTSLLYKIINNRFPKQNDFYQTDFKKELEELQIFGIKTAGQRSEIIDRHLEKF